MTNLVSRKIEHYINDVVPFFLTPIDNIESVKCARRADRIYMEIVHEDSCVRYFDISSMDVSSIGIMICHIISNDPVKREIKDRMVKKEIRKLFK